MNPILSVALQMTEGALRAPITNGTHFSAVLDTFNLELLNNLSTCFTACLSERFKTLAKPLPIR